MKTRTVSSLLSALTLASASASTWTGASANWSSNANPGWNGTGVPDAGGASGFYTGASAPVTTQDVVDGVTVGTLSLGGSAAASSWTFAMSNSITFNQDGGGPGFATISNTNTGIGNNRIIFNNGAGSLVLEDDLLISNTGNSTASSGAVQISTQITGAGNVTISNVSNSITSGYVRLATSANTFTGNVTVQKGAVGFNNASSFGNSANVVTLGIAGQGPVNVQYIGTGAPVIANNFVVAAGTGGTTTLGSTSTSGANSVTFAGTVLLNGDLSVSGANAAGAAVILSNEISGAGNLSLTGTGEVRLTGANTYSGDTTVESGTLMLADNAQMRFVIGADGVSNQINGGGAAILSGDFTFDLSGAASVGSWTIVDTTTLTETFSASFSVVGFTDNGDDTWTSGNYTFYEASGLLVAVPEPAATVLALGGLTLLLGSARRRRA
jgi:autotransporter-associated beta strand protein